MRVHARVWVLGLLTGVLLVAFAPAVAQAAVGIEKFVATNCEVEGCGQKEEAHESGPLKFNFFEPKAVITTEEAETEGFRQVGGRVPFGVTDFKVQTVGNYPEKAPTAIVTHIRTDVAPGLATNPFADERCTIAEFGAESLPETGLYNPVGPECEESEIGSQDATVYTGSFEKGGAGDVPLHGIVYDLVPGGGETMANGAKLAALYGVSLKIAKFLTEGKLTAAFAANPLPEEEFAGNKAEKEAAKKATEEALIKKQYYAHTLIKGSVEWGREARGTNQGDYHDYFEIAVSPSLPLVRSRLVFEGTVGNGAFITNATSCPGNLTTTISLEASEKSTDRKTFTTPLGLAGCNGEEGFEELLFEPTFKFGQSTEGSEAPDEISAEASEPHNPKLNDQSQVESASFTLPEGMTLNPSAAHGLEACTPKQAHEEVTTETGRVFGEAFGVECPSGSKIATVTLNVPTLPDGSLTGSAYLGGPEGEPIRHPPFTMYVVANSAKYGISVRLIGEVVLNKVTGQVTTVFSNPPEQPFDNLALHFERSVLAPVANPLICGTPTGTSSFVPTSAPTKPVNAEFGVSVTGCAATLPFALGQSTENETSNGGGHTSYALNLTRADGEQYLQKVKTTLPEGLVGTIPAVTLCAEAEANAGTCGPASKIGTATVNAGSGSAPYTFSGSVYLTGPYGGGPYGLSIVVPAIAGPFNLGPVVTRASIKVDPRTARVTAESTLPLIYEGIPLRVRSINVNINKQGFLDNPTNCSALATESTLTSSTGTTQAGLNSTFQLANCSALAFKPTFAASTSGKYSKANGASLVTKITQPAGQANIKSVVVTLPKQLPSRLTTLQKSCVQATFEANPLGCPEVSKVGTATIVTPTLPGKMTGPAYLVSHGGEAFPDLDLILEDQGVRIILTGKTDIKNGVTTSSFLVNPDVPVSSVEVNLGLGSHSALAPFGNLCAASLVMPTTMIAQNGKEFKQNTKVSPTSCGVQVVGRKVVGRTAYLTLKTFSAGRISASGKGVKTVSRALKSAHAKVSLKVPLSGARHHRPFKAHIRVGFAPKKGAKSTQSVTVTFH